MKLTCVVLLTYFSVSLEYESGYEIVPERWIWGFVEDPVTKKDEKQNLQETSSTSTTTESSYDPCAEYNPPKPSFKAPGRRISEEKCEEYIYDMKLEDDKDRLWIDCLVKKYETTRKRMDGHGPMGWIVHGSSVMAVGGRRTISGEFPHMGAIGWLGVKGDYVFKCGSTLISSKFMMTAAHCIRAPPDTSIEDPEPKIIRLNDQNLFFTPNGSYHSASSDVNISRIIVHPQYKSPKKYYDIALMELASEVHFTYKLKPACLWNRPDTGAFGKEVSLTGWGVLAHGSYEISPDLQAADVDIIDSKLCDELLEGSRNRHWTGLAEHQLCAGKLEGGVDACQGDSGGPLQFRKPLFSSPHGKVYYVIGITSFGIGCAWANHPGIYTRVSSFIDWIEDNVWK